MKVREYLFHAYYHQFVTIEADELTDKLKNRIEIHDDDCYAICTAYCAEDGAVCFAVLSVGPSWDYCTKGLEKEDIYSVFTMEEVAECEMRILDYDETIARKGNAFLEKQEGDVEEDVLFLRTDERLDNLRDLVYPDIVYVGVIEGTEIVEYDMILTAIDGPFVKGHLIDKTSQHEEYETVMALPYEYAGGIRLLALFVGDTLSHQEETVLEKIREISSRYGITFSGVSIRS